MNVILVVNDTLRLDHVGCYNAPAPWGHTGHAGSVARTACIDKLAADSAIFHACYVSSYPTVPLRHDLCTGRVGFPTRGWEPLDGEEPVIAELLSAAGVHSQFIFDTTPLADDGFNFTRGFLGWDWVRGQHQDRLGKRRRGSGLPAAAYKLSSSAVLETYLANIEGWERDSDWMAQRTTSRAIEWLERYGRDASPFFLWVDMWDPHEPFHAPEYDLRCYTDPDYAGERIIYPRYGRADYMLPEEVNDVRARYAAKVQMADRALGGLLDAVEYLGMSDSTMVIFTTDHGHLFGDHGLQGKPTGPLGMLYEPSIRVPLLIRHPAGLGAGRRISAIVQHPDLFATICDFLGIEAPRGDGISLLPLLCGRMSAIRSVAYSGRHAPALSKRSVAGARRASRYDGWAGIHTISEPITVTTEEWSLIVPPIGGRTPELYNIGEDPGQEKNVVEGHESVVAVLLEGLTDYLVEHGAGRERALAYDRFGEAEMCATRPYFTGDEKLYVCEGDTIDYAVLTAEEAQVVAGESRIRETRLGLLDREDLGTLIIVGGQFYRASDVDHIRLWDRLEGT